ncbi:hypothetical protein [Paenibacillus sp. OSY-SE]|uniref:hypothetical protein n=1 Tax=Paenibacillus sp. OSY-SE TaxID=1196323 RepID=UPI0003646572|nr:hypothetical protein [Paenibacillus sp. OSY-SE]
MRNERFKELEREGHRRGERHKGRGGSHQHGPKTFRRGRAIAFLEMMNLKRSTIKQQLDQPEFQSIHQILVGELKAIDMVINEFIQLFEIHESEEIETHINKNHHMEISESESAESVDNGEKGIESDETN